MVGEPRRIKIAPIEARHLLASYRTSANALAEADTELTSLIREASGLLGKPTPDMEFNLIAENLRSDTEDLEGRLLFLERTDEFGAQLEEHRNSCLASPCVGTRAEHEIRSIARDFANAESAEEILHLVDALVTNEFFRPESGPLWQPMPTELRPILATAFAIAIEQGLSADRIPTWFTAGIIEFGQPRPEVMVDLAYQVATQLDDPLSNRFGPNPFGLSRQHGAMGAVTRTLTRDPDMARAFIDRLLEDHDRTGDTILNRHGDALPSEQLAEIVLAAGTGGRLVARTAFVDRLVLTLNADGNTNNPVFWATWAAHGELALVHDTMTTSPTFGVHRLVPDPIRPHWETGWSDYLSPTILQALSGMAFVGSQTPQRISAAISSQLTGEESARQAGPGNDSGGAYTARSLPWFVDLGWGASHNNRGRHAITSALQLTSPGSAVARDEFAIIDHGLGSNGMATYTVVLPGVIDLSNPYPGFDPVHASVRDLDQVAIHSALNTSVENNRFAQMVVQSLALHEIPLGANLMLVGHSFGADTALDLAADADFSRRYNVSHVVAAAYDSVPQLAAVSPDIDVLVLQNEHDQVIGLEAAHRAVAQGDESVSVNTFSHEVRYFAGGTGTDIGHHPDRYIAYVENTHDDELDRFLESVGAIGYAESGSAIAVDVSIERQPRTQ